jgi:1-acyl-sn-glycerol-3-phosphate acyltransferase
MVLSLADIRRGRDELEMGEIESEAKSYSLKTRGWYKVLRGVIGLLLRTLSRLQVEGLEHVPPEGPYLLATNHLFWLDAPLLMVAFPYRAHVFAGEKWARNPLVGPLFRSLDAIFVERGQVDRKALRQALAVLKGGGVLGLAPEGTRSKTGALQHGHSGAAFMAFRTGVKLVPVVIWGQKAIFPSLRRLRRANVHVVFGPPFEPPVVEGKINAAEVHQFTDEIMYRLAAMLPPAYRGVYADVNERRPDLMTTEGAVSPP